MQQGKQWVEDAYLGLVLLTVRWYGTLRCIPPNAVLLRRLCWGIGCLRHLGGIFGGLGLLLWRKAR